MLEGFYVYTGNTLKSKQGKQHLVMATTLYWCSECWSLKHTLRKYVNASFIASKCVRLQFSLNCCSAMTVIDVIEKLTIEEDAVYAIVPLVAILRM